MARGERCGALVEKDEQVCPGKAWCECAAISVANLGNASESQGVVGLNLYILCQGVKVLSC